MKVRLLEVSFLDNPRYSMAVDEAIFREVISNRSPPTLWLWKHRNAVILGRFQLAEEELNMDYVKIEKIEVAKRNTGGGAVYQDMGNLIFSVISKDFFNIGKDVIKLYDAFISPLINEFKEEGIKAESPGLNDVEISGKKVMGSAASLGQGSVLFHATLLVNSKLDVLASALNVPKEKLKDKGVSEVKHRVGNIQELTGKDEMDVKNIIMRSYEKAYNFEYFKGDLTAEEKKLAEDLYEKKYNRPEWVFGRGFNL
ncbi:biotin/lipoate A/B protein ligase family protein [Acidianus sp. RZ1]|uniref:lipoate--protein ligase family protein n=1 Tax=Acidianus sp. RZ1 TaxID=1540082 RepID=UPI001492C7A8|nr:lipoate--protein ligase family protein [Acidianus sp. RZ1]